MPEEKADALVLHPDDNVAVLLGDFKAGDSIRVKVGDEIRRISLLSDIPFGHKCALQPLRVGDAVLKYGRKIGVATKDIREGEHVHVHNIQGTRAKAPVCGRSAT